MQDLKERRTGYLNDVEAQVQATLNNSQRKRLKQLQAQYYFQVTLSPRRALQSQIAKGDCQVQTADQITKELLSLIRKKSDAEFFQGFKSRLELIKNAVGTRKLLTKTGPLHIFGRSATPEFKQNFLKGFENKKVPLQKPAASGPASFSAYANQHIMEELSKLDQVAYVRFASVYRRFEDVQAFREVIEVLEREAENLDNTKTRQLSLLEGGKSERERLRRSK